MAGALAQYIALAAGTALIPPELEITFTRVAQFLKTFSAI